MNDTNTTENAPDDRHPSRTEQYHRSRPVMPSISITRVSLMMVLLALLAGQVVILRDMGLYAEVQDLFGLAVPFALLYGFWGQIRYAVGRGVALLMKKLDSEGTA